MSIDIFGQSNYEGMQGARGPRGPRGSKGKDGESGMKDFCAWMPSTILKHLQEEEEECCFLITDPEKDIKRNRSNDIVEWVSRTKKPGLFNAKVIEDCASKNIIKIADGRYALDFHKSLYYVEDAMIYPVAGKSEYTYICVTFRVEGGEKEQTIISDYDCDTPNVPFREISVTNTEIKIWGVKNGTLSYIPIQHVTRDWTTLFVEWYNSPDKNQGSYIINNKETAGEFSCSKKTGIGAEIGASIGGRWDKSQFLTGAISALEIYSMANPPSTGTLPEQLKQLIISNQIVKGYKNKASPENYEYQIFYPTNAK